ncbi:MAG: hypothetical protein ACRDZR_04910 [Acidimicrobiales bacterium]
MADIQPGDVIDFDLHAWHAWHAWHASVGGRDRLAWTIIYQNCPKTEAEAEMTRRSMADSFEQAFRGLDGYQLSGLA